MAKRITVGNASITGFVNLVADNRLMIGTGSYTHNGEKVFKESVSVFLDPKFDGTKPEKGDYVQVNGDMIVTPRRDKPEELNVTMNIRFANQLEKKDAPVKKEAAPAGDDI